jgi:hypothetical protein
MAEKPERAHKRKLMHEHAFVSGGDPTHWLPVVLMDISVQGVSFATSSSPELGRNCILRFFLPGTNVNHQSSLRIIHISSDGVPEGFRIGARFLDAEPATVRAITDFLSLSI